jgi:hypothetical protein
MFLNVYQLLTINIESFANHDLRLLRQSWNANGKRQQRK